jgi:hypothetical protein
MTVRSRLPGNPGHHAVQFYRDETRLRQTVADFLADGIVAGQPTIVVATPAHRRLIENELSSRRFDIPALVRGGTLLLLDARDTLDCFMLNGRPDPVRFRQTVGAAIERVSQNGDELVVRAYGELVDVLWRVGECDAALQLEILWNELATRYAVSLLCGCAMAGFDESAGHELVCFQHTHVHGVSAIN